MIVLPLLALLLLFGARLWGAGLLAGYFSPDGIESVERGLTVAVVVAAALLIDGLFRFFYWHRYWRRRRGRETPALIRDLVTIAIVLFALSLALWWEEGVSFTGLITASGATAIILGIALQTVIQDLFSGLSINLEGSYALGDWLTIYSEHLPEPTYGRVTGITWRSTFLELEDCRRLMVPNHLATANAVLNHSRPPGAKRLSVELNADIRVPSERVIAMLLGEAMKVTRGPGMAAAPAPTVVVDHVSSDAIFYRVRFYSDPHVIGPPDAQSLMYRALLSVVQQNALPMAVTQVEMTAPPDLTLDLGDPQVRAAIGHADLFANVLNEEQSAFLAGRCKVREFPVAGALMRQGDEASSMFLILEGAARVTIEAQGAAQEVAVLAAGDVVGEMSLMTGARRSATVTALTAMRTLEVTKEPIAELLQKSPDLLTNFSRALARRQEGLNAVANRPLQKTPDAGSLLARMTAFFSSVLKT